MATQLELTVDKLAVLSDEAYVCQDIERIAKSFEKTVEEIQAMVLKARQANEEDTPLEIIDDPYPPFPLCFGPVHELALCVAPSLAYEHKMLHLLTDIGLSLSGKVQLVMEHWLQPRFYSVMTGPPGTTKSAVDKECRSVIFPHPVETVGKILYSHPPLSTSIAIKYSINSGPALVQAFEDDRIIMLAVDELSSLFEKGRTTTTSSNSLFGELLRLYESNETGRNVARKGKRGEDHGENVQIDDAHLAIIAGATKDSLERVWQGTGGAASGLQSRFVLTYSELPLPPFQTPTDEHRVDEVMSGLLRTLAHAPDTLTWNTDAQDAVRQWHLERGGSLAMPPRVLDMGKRAMMILAACDGASTITRAVAVWGLAFADYQMQIKARLFPLDAENSVQAFENRVIAFFQRHTQASANEVRRGIHPQRFPGGYAAYDKAMFTLIRVGVLVKKGANRSGKIIYRLD